MKKKVKWKVTFTPSRDGETIVVDIDAPDLGMRQKMPARSKMLEELLLASVVVIRNMQNAIMKAAKLRRAKK
jgi:hypothetical protein